MGGNARILVVGGGIAGMSLASEAARDFHVTVVEAELQPGYHSSGRSAAIFLIPFVNDVVHRLSVASEAFFREPPDGFATLSRQLPNILTAEAGEEHLVEAFLDTWSARCGWLERMDGAEIRAAVPIVGAGVVCGAMDAQSLALDVHNLLDGHRRRLLERGGAVMSSARVLAVERRAGRWVVRLENGVELEGDVVVNASGAWADEIAAMAGATAIGLRPKRRTGILIDPGRDPAGWPMVHVAAGNLYYKPEGPLLMVSPADETDSAPCDAQPDEWDVAVGVERMGLATTLEIERPVRTWAGLRSFVPDKLPVIGFDPSREGFFWLAAFGGFGVQTSPAYSRFAASLLAGRDVADEIGIDANDVSPSRLLTQRRSQ